MSISYRYVAPDEMSAFRVIRPGPGTFKVTAAEEKTSRAGNRMLVVTFRLTDERGQSTLANEYLVESQDEAANKGTATKIYNLLTAINRSDLYGRPLEARHIVHGHGKCIIKTEVSDDAKYKDKSVIAQYINTTLDEYVHTEDIEDTIPF